MPPGFTLILPETSVDLDLRSAIGGDYDLHQWRSLDRSHVGVYSLHQDIDNLCQRDFQRQWNKSQRGCSS